MKSHHFWLKSVEFGDFFLCFWIDLWFVWCGECRVCTMYIVHSIYTLKCFEMSWKCRLNALKSLWNAFDMLQFASICCNMLQNASEKCFQKCAPNSCFSYSWKKKMKRKKTKVHKLKLKTIPMGPEQIKHQAWYSYFRPSLKKCCWFIFGFRQGVTESINIFHDYKTRVFFVC